MMCNDGTNGKAFRDSGLYDGWPPASALADPENASDQHCPSEALLPWERKFADAACYEAWPDAKPSPGGHGPATSPLSDEAACEQWPAETVKHEEQADPVEAALLPWERKFADAACYEAWPDLRSDKPFEATLLPWEQKFSDAACYEAHPETTVSAAAENTGRQCNPIEAALLPWERKFADAACYEAWPDLRSDKPVEAAMLPWEREFSDAALYANWSAEKEEEEEEHDPIEAALLPWERKFADAACYEAWPDLRSDKPVEAAMLPWEREFSDAKLYEDAADAVATKTETARTFADSGMFDQWPASSKRSKLAVDCYSDADVFGSWGSIGSRPRHMRDAQESKRVLSPSNRVKRRVPHKLKEHRITFQGKENATKPQPPQPQHSRSALATA